MLEPKDRRDGTVWLAGSRHAGLDPLQFERDPEKIFAFPTITEGKKTILDRPYTGLVRPN
jgi:hypothetical protein